MQARNNKELRKLIRKYESRHHTSGIYTYALTLLGFIGFGLFAVPIYSTHITPPTYVPIAAIETPRQAKQFEPVPVTAHAALVYDLKEGKVLYGKNETTKLPLASLTKLITTYAAVTSLPQNTPVRITDSMLAPEGDSGLKAGEIFSLRTLERFALVASSNDAAEAVALTAADKKNENDQSLLANVISALGLTSTEAHNSTGLDLNTTESGAYGSALDIATLAGSLQQIDPELAAATTRAQVSGTSLEGVVHTLSNTNQGIVHIPNPLLSKTGFTDLAGGNLVVVFDAGINHPVAVVVLGATRDSRFTDVDALVNQTLKYFAPAQSSAAPVSKP